MWKINILSFDIIFVPIYLRNHCVSIDLKLKEIIDFDSLKANNPQYKIALGKKYLNDKSKSKGKVKYDFNIWSRDGSDII